MIKDGKVYDSVHFCFINGLENGVYQINDFQLLIMENKPYLEVFKYSLIQQTLLTVNCTQYNYEFGPILFSNSSIPFANSFTGMNETLDVIFDKRFQEIQDIFHPPESDNNLELLCNEMSPPSFDSGFIPTSQLNYMVTMDEVTIEQLEAQRNKVSQSELFSECTFKTLPHLPVHSQNSNTGEPLLNSDNRVSIVNRVSKKRKLEKENFNIPELSKLVYKRLC